MEIKTMPNSWKGVFEGGYWRVQDKNGSTLATVENVENAEECARLMVNAPAMLEALKGMVALIGDEDLEDNGELSGAAICDLAREVVGLASQAWHI